MEPVPRVHPQLRLDPEDWRRATWRDLDPLEASPPEFDLEDGLHRLSRVKRDGWDNEFSAARIAPVLSRQEARFWFEAMMLLGTKTARVDQVEKELVAKEIKQNHVMRRVRATPSIFLKEELVLPMAALLGRVVLAEMLCEPFASPGERWDKAAAIGRLADGYARWIAPYLTREQRAEIRELIRPKLAPSRISDDQYSSLPMTYYLAAQVGLHDEVAELVHGWADERYATYFGEDTDDYQRPQLVVFGLGDAEDVQVQMRRLGLRLKRGSHIRAWLAHTEVSALGEVRDAVLAESNKKAAAVLAEHFALVEAPEAAESMLEIKLGSKAPWVARRWLDEHPRRTIAGLIRTVGKRGGLADAAVEQLRRHKREGYLGLIQGSADEAGVTRGTRLYREVIDHEEKVYQTFSVGERPPWLREALAFGVPGRRKLPDWLEADSLPPLVIEERRLSEQQLEFLLKALRVSQVGEAHDLVSALRQHATIDSRDAFAWRLFQNWLEAGAPSKEKWAMRAVGFLGGDGCALKLAPLVRAWPGESQHARAALGLECLRGIGSDTALMQLHGIAQKVKYKGIRKKAGELMEAIARDLQLTRPELEDRIVPHCDLDRGGSCLFDFGPRHFTFLLGSDLKPNVRDETGKLRKTLPKAGVKDDAVKAAVAHADWKRLKKQLREVLKIQVPRLEQAMIQSRRWRVDDFQRFLVLHPLMTYLARLVVWGGYNGSGELTGTFRLTDEQDFTDIHDGPCSIDAFARVGIVHPVHLSEGEQSGWAEVWGDYELISPFQQLGRPVFRLEPDEGARHELTRFADIPIAAMTLVGTLERLDWLRGVARDGGIFYEHLKPFHGADVTAVARYLPGVPAGYLDGWDVQQLEQCFFVRGMTSPEMSANPRKSLRLDQVDDVAVSEVLMDLSVLISKT